MNDNYEISYCLKGKCAYATKIDENKIYCSFTHCPFRKRKIYVYTDKSKVKDHH